LANEWGRGFIAELAYTEEAANTIQFNEDMKIRGLNAITAPIVVEELSTERILCTEWVEGTRLDLSTAEDVPRLCSVALNAYLVMLLETGTLHCDPHPGNLMRTDDGKLCILDFGMTIDTDPSLQYALLEFVAHITSEAYDEVPTDLVKLGFLKEERLDTVRASGFLEPLTYMLKQTGQGGGAKKVRARIFNEYREKFPGVEDDELRVLMRGDMKSKIEERRKQESAVSGITMEVEELQKRNKDAFSIPEWFLYCSRAFLTLEGICLQADEDYSIVQSCFPYVARRLLNDDSPRAQAALKDLLYGAGNLIEPDRLTDLASGFSTYTTTTKSINSVSNDNVAEQHEKVLSPVTGSSSTTKKNAIADTEAAVTLAKDSADILLSPDGNLVQDIIVAEGTAAASAQIKDTLRDILLDGPNRIRSSLPFGNLLPKPPEEEVSPFLKKTEEEERAQLLLGKIGSLAPSLPTPSLPNGLPLVGEQNGVDEMNNDSGPFVNLDDLDPEQLALLSKELRENVPKYAPLVWQLGGKFSSTLLQRTSEDIEMTLSEGSEDTNFDRIVRVAAKGFSNVASQGANALTQPSTTEKERD